MRSPRMDSSCLSSCSYIKPQPAPSEKTRLLVVYHLVPTSNHNSNSLRKSSVHVVYHLVPTSNHNGDGNCLICGVLFIILFLHQTTTIFHKCFNPSMLFIILFLHQTTTQAICALLLCALFIILFLHQTTTLVAVQPILVRCLSSCSYIKPQHRFSSYTNV